MAGCPADKIAALSQQLHSPQQLHSRHNGSISTAGTRLNIPRHDPGRTTCEYT